MDPRLETFLTLCRTMHYGRAAEALNLSQPAVSKHIQALEAQYGAKLFDYSGRRLSRTRAGELLEQYASTLRYNEEKLIAAMHARPETLLRIGATKSIGDYILLPEIRRFLSAPGNRLTFLVDNTARLLSQLEAGELDFVVLEGIFDKARYDSFRVRMEPYIGVCAHSHPFAGREVPLEELFRERLILREEGSGTRNILERELAQQGGGLRRELSLRRGGGRRSALRPLLLPAPHRRARAERRLSEAHRRGRPRPEVPRADGGLKKRRRAISRRAG